jgi:hypothetical protein
MRLLAPIATTFLLVACGASGDDIAPPTIDPEKEAEIARLRPIQEAFRSISIELSDGMGGQHIEGSASPGLTLNYSVTVNNPTANQHGVAYGVNWWAPVFVPRHDACIREEGIGLPPKAELPNNLEGWEVLRPLQSVTRVIEFSPVSKCFVLDLSWASAFIIYIDGFDQSNVEWRIAQLEGREIDY